MFVWAFVLVACFSLAGFFLPRGSFSGTVADIVSPLLRPFTAAGSSVAGSVDFVARLWSAARENAVLRDETAQLRAELADTTELARENELLRRQLGIAERGAFTLLGARIVSYDPLHLVHAALIDKGTRDGVADGMPVILPGNIVFGSVTETFDRTARIALVSEKNSKISVLSRETGTTGVLSGLSGTMFLMDLVEKNAPFAVGDLIVTSGIDGKYPRGLIVGTVHEIITPEEGIFQQARVEPAFSRLVHPLVFIIAGQQQ